MMSLPYLPLYLVTEWLCGPGFWTLVWIFVAFGWMFDARLCREFSPLLEKYGIRGGARSIGASPGWIMLKHLLVNCGSSDHCLCTSYNRRKYRRRSILELPGSRAFRHLPYHGSILQNATNLYFPPQWPLVDLYPVFLFLTVLSFNFMGTACAIRWTPG